MFSSETVKKNLNANFIAIKNVPLSIIQSLIIIATCFVYYTEINLNTMFITAASCCLAYGLAFISRFLNWKIKPIHVFAITSMVLIAVFHDSIAHAQLLEGIEDALGDVSEAAGGSFAEEVIEAIVQIVRIAIFIVVTGVVIAAIFFGVSQNQWQAPVLVVGVIAAIALFMEIMGQVVFG